MGTVPAGRTAKLTSDPQDWGDHSQGAREEGHETGGNYYSNINNVSGGRPAPDPQHFLLFLHLFSALPFASITERTTTML